MKLLYSVVIIQMFCVLILSSSPVRAGGEDEACPPSVLTVRGSGEVAARPDQAVIRLGAVVQAGEASEAQHGVNRILENAVERIKALSIPENKITTVGLSLSPVYAGRGRSGGHDEEPRIVGYRARSSIEVEVEDTGKAGEVIDAGISTGANQVEGISFGLKDDTPYRLQALRMAMENARLKARKMAEAGGFVLGAVKEVVEQQSDLISPRGAVVRALASAEAATPVQPGEIRVEASVMVKYRIEE